MARLLVLVSFCLGIALAQLTAPSNLAIFSTQANTPISQNVVFTNVGSFAVGVSSVTFDGPDASLFVATLPSLPATVNQAATLTVPISFQPTNAGLKEAVMIVTNSLGSKTFVYLTGVSAAGLGGVLEPSLQYILAANRLEINVGDNDPSDNIIAATAAAQNTALLGDEITAQFFEKANMNQPISFDVLAAFGPTANDPVCTFGSYAPATAALNPILSVSNAPGNNGQTMNPVVSGTPSFDPKDTTFGLYTQWPYFQNRLVYSEDALNTWDNGDHHIRVYRYKNEQGQVLNDTLVIAFEEDSTNKDFNDIVLVARNIKVASSGKIQNLEIPRDVNGNLQAGWRNDLFTGFKIDSGENLFILRRHFGNTFVVTNMDQNTPLTITAMTFSTPADWALYPTPTFPMTVAAGQNASFNATFIKNGGEPDRYESTLTITTNDSAVPTQMVTLEGLYMSYPEDINELALHILNNGFGFHSNMYNPMLQMTIDGRYAAPLNGEEVRSRFWQQADASLPVYARKTGSFRQCCNDSGIIQFIDGSGNVLDQMVDTNVWSQTILPMSWGEMSEFTEMTYTPGPNFALVSGLGGPWTSWSTNTYGPQQGVKVWPIRDYWSEIVSNMYLLGQDFIWDGCGNGGNCDFNDNFAHINNIKPVAQDGIDQRAMDQSYYVALGDASTQISWNRAYAAFTLKDSAGVSTGFVAALSSGADTNLDQSAFQANQLTVTGGALNVNAQPGSMIGASDNMINALFVRFNGRDRPFTVSSNLKNLAGVTGAQQKAGIYLGSDKQYFSYLTLTGAGNVEFYSEVNDTGSVVGSVPVTVAGLTNLRLILTGDYRTNTLTAMYEAYYASSFSSGLVGTYQVPDVFRGYWFGKPSQAGIYTSSLGGNTFTVAYDDFDVLVGNATFYSNTLPTFLYGQFVPDNSVTSSSAATTATSATTDANTPTGTPTTGSSDTNNPISSQTTDSNTPTGTPTGTPTQETSETGPESCGPSDITSTDQTARPTENPTSAPAGTPVGQAQGSGAGLFAPMLAFLVAALALTL